MSFDPLHNRAEDFFVARQPIFDKQRNTWGYELLFRNAAEKSTAEVIDQDFASVSVATCGFLKAQEVSDQTKKICINFTEKLILCGCPKALPPSVCVIEILEDIEPTPLLIEKIIDLKQDGYLIAIDDYGENPWQDELLDFADIIKVDILGHDFDWIKDIYTSLQGKHALKLAEKVEDRETLNLLQELGFDLFQGFFFATPENLSGRKLSSNQCARLKILEEVNKVDASPERIIELISTDPSITYRLLTFLNSPAFGFSIKINSIRHAVALLGGKRLRYWLRMLVMSDLSGDRTSSELYMMALNRGRLLEELTANGQIKKVHPETMFLFGVLSLIDIMLDQPMNQVIDKLPLLDEIKSGYVDLNSSFADYVSLMAVIENGDTQGMSAICQKIDIELKDVAEASVRSAIWSQRMATCIMDGKSDEDSCESMAQEG